MEECLSMFMHQGPTVPISSLGIMLHGHQLQTMTNVDMPSCSFLTIPTVRMGLSGPTLNYCLYVVRINEVGLEKQPILFMPPTMHLLHEGDLT